MGGRIMNRRRTRRIPLLLSLCLVVSLLCLAPARAEAADVGAIDRVLCSLNYSPVAMMELQYVKVSTSSADCYITSAIWTDPTGAQVTGTFGTGNYTLTVTYSAAGDKVFSAGALGYINNKNDGVSVSVSADGKTATLQKTFSAEIWAPTAVKQPTSEKVSMGSWTSFAVSSTYAESHEWFFESADGKQTVPAANASAAWSGLSVTGMDSEHLVLHNVPAEMDGWKVYCRHWSVNHLNYTDTSRATISVINIPTPAPTPEFTPVPLEVPSPEPAAEATPVPTPLMADGGSDTGAETQAVPEATPAPVNRSYSYAGDSTAHWLVYDDNGETGEREEHLYVWHETRAATNEQDGEETGVCSICGQTATRPLGRQSGGSRSALGLGEKLGIDGLSDIQLLLLGGSAVCLLLLILSAALSPRRRRRRR